MAAAEAPRLVDLWSLDQLLEDPDREGVFSKTMMFPLRASADDVTRKLPVGATVRALRLIDGFWESLVYVVIISCPKLNSLEAEQNRASSMLSRDDGGLGRLLTDLLPRQELIVAQRRTS